MSAFDDFADEERHALEVYDERGECERCGVRTNDTTTVTRVLFDEESGAEAEETLTVCWGCRS